MTDPAEGIIYVVEDDPKIAGVLVDYLKADGYLAVAIGGGAEALRQIRAAAPRAIILDLMLPGVDGVQVCEAVRQFSDVPILMLTARIDEIDRLIGLDAGADDYVCKPFSNREVIARVRALIRRAEGHILASIARWRVDADRMSVSHAGVDVPLTAVEFRLLSQLLARPGRIYSRSQLLDAIQTEHRDVSDRAVDSHIKNIRRKLAEAGVAPEVIASVYGAGYRFEEQ